jgi:peptidoglycan biosynthesis protein MviN/MurJ (putative lipid II flippase)
MWKYLYDGVLTFFTSPWAPFITKYAAPGRLVRDVFFTNVYQYSGIILFTVCLISCLLYYFYFNKRFGNYHLKRTWFKWMIITSLIIAILTYFVGRSLVSSFIIPTNAMIIWLSAINFVYGIFLFIIISIFCQLAAIITRKLFSYDLSPMGYRTPF